MTRNNISAATALRRLLPTNGTMIIYTRLCFSMVVLLSLPAIGLAVVVSDALENHILNFSTGC